LRKIPAIVKVIADDKLLELAHQKTFRGRLNAEEAKAYKNLIDT